MSKFWHNQTHRSLSQYGDSESIDFDQQMTSR